MPIKYWLRTTFLALTWAISLLLPAQLFAAPVGTAFTYQGSLSDGSHTANGVYDLQFALWDAPTGGALTAGPLTNSTVTVTNGGFAVTLDFGNLFQGTALWLELGVRTNGALAFATLAPRQLLTPTPYALYSLNAGTATTAATATVVAATNITGTLPWAQLPTGVMTNGGTYGGQFVMTNPNNILGSAWNPATQGQWDTPPKGASTWFGGIGDETEANVLNNVSNMVANGMVANGFNTLLLDGGTPNTYGDSPFPVWTNFVAYAALTNGPSAPWLDFDTNYFPHGAKWLISVCHSNGVKVFLYAFNGRNGGNASFLGTNVVTDCQPGFLGSAYYFGWLSNAITSWGLDGIKDEVSGANFTNAILQQSLIANLTRTTDHPFYVNVATPSGYQPWYHGLFNSWRIGVGIIGDVTSLPAYYTWLDNTPFSVSAPASFNDLDEYQPGDYFNESVDDLMVRNKLALDSLANAPIQLGSIPARQRDLPLSEGYYYENYDNPLVSAIDNDLSSHVSVVSSNSTGVVVYAKQLQDGTYTIAMQNRSATSSHTGTVGIANLYPGLANGIVTIHDCFLNAPMALATNSYSANIGTNSVAWFKLMPGIEQVFPAGSNSLSRYPWSSCYFPWTGDSIAVDGYGGSGMDYGSFGGLPAPFRGNPSFPTNNTALEFYPDLTNEFTWMVNGNAVLFTCNLNGWIGNTDCKFYGDGNLLAEYTCSNNINQGVSVNLTGVNAFQLVMTNTEECYVYLGDPTIVCPSQTTYDPYGKARTYVTAGTYSGTFTGDGCALTNLNAAQISSGTLSLVQLPIAVVTNNETGVTLNGTFMGSGAGLANLNAAHLIGTVSPANLPGVTTNISTAGITLYITNGLIMRVGSP